MKAARGVSLLVLRGDSGGLVVPAELVERLDTLDRLCPVPGAPAAVAGIAESGGRVVTLLSAAAFAAPSREAEPSQPPPPTATRLRCALRLASPYENLALLVEPGMSIAVDRGAGGEGWPRLDAEGIDRLLRELAARREEAAP